MGRYRVLLPLAVHTPDGGPFEQGDEFDCDFTVEDEAENLRSGLLAVVSRAYRVVGDSIVHDTAKGDTFEAALSMTEEAHLVAAGHVERVEDPAPAEPGTNKPRASRKAKEA